MRIFPAVFLAFLLILANCSSPPVQDYAYTPPQIVGARLCTDQCGLSKSYCHQGCDFDYRTCTKDVQTQAMNDYAAYTKQQFDSHAPIEFRPRDFERMTPCDDKKKECTNDCESPYAACYKNCGGSVTLSTSCTFLCF